MDNLRGLDSDRSPLDDIDGDYVIEEANDAGLERPPAIGTDERRMQVRAYNFWTRLLFDHDYPLIEDLDPANAMDFGEYSVLLDFRDGIDNPAIGYVGPAIVEECELKGPIARLDDVHPRSLLSRITDHYMQIHANRAPIGFEAEFVNQRGATILYRGILLPFSSDGSVIDYIYGVINWKEAVDGAQADELMLEVRHALDAIDVEAPALPAWVDGLADGEAMADSLFDSRSLIDAFRHEEQPIPDEIPLPEPGPDDTLHDWLQAARLAADSADMAERRSRQTLYEAIGRAYDFALAAEKEPQLYDELLVDAGLKTQPRTPYTALAKLVFGAGYDKTRLAEIATVIGRGRDEDVAPGECADWIARYKGGVKAIVADARAVRRGRHSVARIAIDKLHARLRTMPARPLSDFGGGMDEFVLIVGRRGDGGNIELIGAIEEDSQFTKEALNKLLD